MLDAFIIERIIREKTQENREQIPLYIKSPPPPAQKNKENEEERGVAIIDFTI